MDRETQLQVAVSSIVVLAFVGVLAFVSTVYSVDGGITKDGGYALVGSLVLFVFVLSGAGLFITGREDD
jgi:peptidoglycan/LPS O-acetylase OafA/YrhL